MNKPVTVTALILIILAIILGALAAHGLKDLIAEEEITFFEKGVRYQMYMALGLLAVGLGAEKIVLPLRTFLLTAILGVILFSGGLYLWSFHLVLTIPKIIVALIPFGGLLMIASWVILLIKIIKQKST